MVGWKWVRSFVGTMKGDPDVQDCERRFHCMNGLGFRIQCTSVKSSLFAGNRIKINTRFLAEIKYHIKSDSTLFNSAPHIRVDM